MRYLAVFAISLSVALPAHASDQPVYGPVPSWISPNSLPAAAATATDAPITFLLFDNQARLGPGVVETYSHYAFRINNAQGLSAGNVVAAWDPAFGDLTVHRVVIRRGDQQIDALAKGQKFTILRREQELEQQTLNGQLTATLQPEGLQAGDILEVEISQSRRDPTLRDHLEMKGGFNVPVRTEEAMFRVILPAKSSVQQRLSGGLSQPTVVTKGADKILTWKIAPLLPETAPAFAPSRYANGKLIEISDFNGWDDVAQLFLPLFEKASAISADSGLRPEIERIKAASADPLQRAGLALRLVEEKIRYVNLALGVGGLVPASADETWRRRFGDCKAKTALLTGLLHELGIDAVPVLVSSTDGDGLDERLPMVGSFDHVVVRSNIGGKTYWLDGTRTGDIAITHLDTPLYYWGLPIARKASLVSIKPLPRTLPNMETTIYTDASAGVAKPVPTKLDIVMRGDLALMEQNVLSALDPSLRDQAMRKQLQSTLDRFEIDKVSGSYETSDGPAFRLHGEGRQTIDLNGGIYWTEVPSPGYEADFARTGSRDLNAPVKIDYPSYSRTKQIIVLPKERVSRTTFKVAPISATVAGIEYRRTVTNANGIVTIDGSYRSLVPEIGYAEARAAENRLRELDNDNIWIRFSDSAPVATDEVKQLIGHDPKGANDFIQAAVKMMASGEAAKAIGALDKALQLEPASAAARMMRAQLRFAAGDLPGVREDAAAAVKADPRNWTARALLAEVYRRDGKLDEAYAQAKALEKVDNSRAQVGMGQILISLGRPGEALAAFDRALSFDKDPATYVYRAMALPASDKAERKKNLESALKLNPADSFALSGLAELASQLGDHAQALQLLDRAFLKSPDDVNIRNRRAIEMQLLGKTADAKREFDALAAKDLDAAELNNLCWTKALANVALDLALAECDRSLAKNDSFAAHDSRAMVLLRQARFDDAIKEYGLALGDKERAASLYGRALAYARKGDKAKADADAAQAMKLEPGIERNYAYYGLGL